MGGPGLAEPEQGLRLFVLVVVLVSELGKLLLASGGLYDVDRWEQDVYCILFVCFRTPWRPLARLLCVSVPG